MHSEVGSKYLYLYRYTNQANINLNKIRLKKIYIIY